MARRLWERQGNPVQTCKALHRRVSIELFMGEMRLGKITLCFRASLFTGEKKKLRTWSNKAELSLREKQYQLPYRWPWTAIALLTSFQNIIKETSREKQSFNLCPRTGSVYNVPKWEMQIEPCPVAALHYLPHFCGHFDPMWSTKRNFVNCLCWSYLVTGLSTQWVSPNSLLLTWVPHIINSIYFSKDGFPYLPLIAMEASNDG